MGVADPSSTMATVGVIDVGHLSRSAHLLTTACETVTGASSSKEEVGGWGKEERGGARSGWGKKEVGGQGRWVGQERGGWARRVVGLI